MASEGEVVLSYHDTLLRTSDVALLKERQWLNDNIISFWLEYLEYDLYADFAQHVSFIAPQVAHFIKSAAGHPAMRSDVVTVLQTMDLNKKKLLVVPINDQATTSDSIGGSHWSLLVCCNQSFEHYDSCPDSGNRLHAEQIASTINPLLSDVKLGFAEKDCTWQSNGYDCGIHLMVNAEAACRKVFKGDARKVSDIASSAVVKQTRKLVLDLISDLRNNKNKRS